MCYSLQTTQWLYSVTEFELTKISSSCILQEFLVVGDSTNLTLTGKKCLFRAFQRKQTILSQFGIICITNKFLKKNPVVPFSLPRTWWCYGMDTLSALLFLCAGNPLVTNEFPGQKYVNIDPDSKVHAAHMGPIWVLLAPGGPHVGHMNFAIRGALIVSLMLPWKKKHLTNTQVEGEVGSFTTQVMPLQIAELMGPTRGPPWSCRPQMGPMLAPWPLLSGTLMNKYSELGWLDFEVKYQDNNPTYGHWDDLPH